MRPSGPCAVTCLVLLLGATGTAAARVFPYASDIETGLVGAGVGLLRGRAEARRTPIVANATRPARGGTVSGHDQPAPMY